MEAIKQYTSENRPMLDAIGSGKRVLEIGCSTGTQTRVMSQVQNCQVTAVELDPIAAEQARPFCERLVVGNVETLSLEEITCGARYDVITFADVLEHLRDPVACLQKLQPALHEDGYIVASIPNIVHCAVVYEMAHGRFEYRPWGLLDDTHIRFFTLDSVQRSFREADLMIVSVDRARRPAAQTEFLVQTETPDDVRFLEYIKQHNPEAETYQFIIKALPLASHKFVAKQYEEKLRDQAARYKQKIDEQAAQLTQAQQRIRELSETLDAQKAQLRRLDSELSWAVGRPTYRFLAALANFVKRRRASS